MAKHTGSAARRTIGFIGLTMLVCATSLSAQTTDSTRLRVLVFPTYDKQGWAVARALNRELISQSKIAVISTAFLEHMWATGGALVETAFIEPIQATRGDITHPSDRRAIAQYFRADMLVALVPDSLRPDSAVSVLISTKPMMTAPIRNIGTWVISNIDRTAAAIHKAIRADTAFQRLTKQRK